MLQSDERLSERLTVYVYPSVKIRIDREVEASPWDLPGWLRYCIDETLLRLELDKVSEGDITAETVSDAPLAVQLAASQAQVAGQEQVITLLRERLGLADAQNIELNQRLGESHAMVDRVTLALPAPSEDAGPTRRGWQFWKR